MNELLSWYRYDCSVPGCGASVDYDVDTPADAVALAVHDGWTITQGDGGVVTYRCPKHKEGR